MSSIYYRQNTYEEANSLSTSLSDTRKEWSRAGSCSSFEDPSAIVKKKPILKQSSFPRRKKVIKTSRKISFKKEIQEVFDVESYKEFNTDMSEVYDFMGLNCPKSNCELF